MEFSLAAMTKYLVTGEKARGTHSSKAVRCLDNKQ